eukprot:NODE_11880_length_1260_cov_3.809356.p2 GENE.NODE_11880_length_1260_cov_3.809356~~NODE_11880_length_1260_cov_3.809356.p2  ORF type:complete len:191 (-),score=47.77 NODE_11880_length_1260_cov_3.809356:84-656(-)
MAAADYKRYLPAMVSNHDSALAPNATQLNRLFEQYPVAEGDCRMVAGRFTTDVTFGCGSIVPAAMLAAAPVDVFLYRFNHRPTCFVLDVPGVLHSNDLGFIWGVPLAMCNNWTAEELDLSARLQAYWGSFVRDLNPGAKFGRFDDAGGWRSLVLQTPVDVPDFRYKWAECAVIKENVYDNWLHSGTIIVV